MRINCPICGERDMREFQYLGSAKLLERPMVTSEDISDAQTHASFHNYVHLRENREGENAELWLHEFGCRAWLHAIRHTKTHKFGAVRLAKEIKGQLK